MKYFIILGLLFINGCAVISSWAAPDELKNTVSKAAEVSRISIQSPPEGENLKQYLIINAAMWEQLEIFYNLKKE